MYQWLIVTQNQQLRRTFLSMAKWLLLTCILTIIVPRDRLVIKAIISPPQKNYDLSHLRNISLTQTNIVVDAWFQGEAWVNPSMIIDPNHRHRVVMVWRMPDKGRHDKIGYMWLDPRTWTISKKKDMIGRLTVSSQLI